MKQRLEDKVALVTGAGSGIGRASALEFAKEGARVAVIDVVAEGGEETVKMIEESGGKAIFIQTDVTKATEVEAMVDRIVQTYGRLDCVHNNAGRGSTQLATADCPEEEWDNILNINLKSVWLCMKYEIPQMLKQGKGAIVNTASIAGLVGFPKRPAYAASKHGVVGLTRAAALDYAKEGIRINAVCPGVIGTPMIKRMLALRPESATDTVEAQPIPRLGTPEEVAQAVVWLCSDEASFVTGHPMSVDGGFAAK